MRFSYELQGTVRPVPAMDVQDYKTYSYSTPPRTHFRPADCEEYRCEGFRFGFILFVDLSTDLGLKQANFALHDRMRSYKTERTGLYEVRFIYPPGTRCWEWREHRVPVDRPPILIVRGGDWRGSTGLIRKHSRVEYWAEDFAEHQDKLAEQFKRG